MGNHSGKWSLRVLVVLSFGGFMVDSASAQSLWRESGGGGWIADHVARQIGDLITVLVEEQQNVQDDGRVERSRDTSMDAALESFTIAPNAFETLPAVKYRSSRTLDGKSRYLQRGAFRTTISAVIVDVQANGTLLIEGYRVVNLDGEFKRMRIRGWVRPLDITVDNTVQSSQVAHADVEYISQGDRSNTTGKAWFSKFIDFIWPF